MIQQRSFFASLLIAVIATTVFSQVASAGDYVWGRTAWGCSNASRHYGSFSNGYGGYYVPRNGYGNNQESRGRITNPNGVIVSTGVAQSDAGNARR